MVMGDDVACITGHEKDLQSLQPSTQLVVSFPSVHFGHNDIGDQAVNGLGLIMGLLAIVSGIFILLGR
jgi:hypothetical protein